MCRNKGRTMIKTPSSSKILCWMLFTLTAITSNNRENVGLVSGQQCGGGGGDGICSATDMPDAACTLYMAESTIPNSGWGVFTGTDRKIDNENEEDNDAYIEPFDVTIPFPDYDYQMDITGKNQKLPEWLLKDYHWTSIATQMMYDADHVHSISPGLGMLANSHTFLYNLRNDGCLIRKRSPRNNDTYSVGSYSHCQEMAFGPMNNLKAGDELFVEYGDDWFEEREEALGVTIPMWDDYERVNVLVRRWSFLMERQNIDLKSDVARDTWEMLILSASSLMKPRIQAALPLTHEDALKTLNDPMGSASVHFPNRSRSIEDLKQNGMCLDNIESKESELVKGQRGGVAYRDIMKNQVVAPVPVVQLSRQHMEILIADYDGHEIWWKGQQLLLNYCYGHKDSSVLLFPYSPGVNLINHVGGMIKPKDGKRMKPNVALRWSDKTNQDLLKLSADELINKPKASGLMMELVALRHIEEGEEILLDYGTDFDLAYQKHIDRFEPPVHSNTYKSAWELEIADEVNHNPPSYVQHRCWVNAVEAVATGEEDEEGYYDFVPAENNGIDITLPCEVISEEYDEDEEKTLYSIKVYLEDDSEVDSKSEPISKGKKKKAVKIKDAPWDAITFVEKAYTGNHLLRQSFRHEIRLPDDVFPDAWKDLKLPGAYHIEKCGLYMAESAIPNSGYGMYTTKPFDEFETIFHPDVVIQVEDYQNNMRLRRLLQNTSKEEEGEPRWLIDSYYWNAEITYGYHEADGVISIVPGLGMLANSHPGLVNAEIRATNQLDYYLDRNKDPGAGASTAYHNVHFYAPHKIEVGEELFVKYGDTWFEDREDLGSVPLEADFKRADAVVSKYHRLSTSSIKSSPDAAKDLWNLVGNLPLNRDRLKSALPKDISEVEKVAKTGSAKFSTPNRIRSTDWLEENGVCLDNIYPADSLVPGAGKGAFAERFIKKGSIVAPLPVVHILRKDLEVYEEIFDSKNKPTAKFLGYQLLMNYCYGHPKSSIMLFPYSPTTNYINHNATSPNVKLQWSKMSKEEWLNLSPDDLRNEKHAGLVMELVALRDIQENEEIFLSYGDEWELAWREHVIDFHAPDEDQIRNYVPASSLNRRVEWLRTEKELKENPYPLNIVTACFVGHRGRAKPMGKSRDGLMEFFWMYYQGIFDDVENSFHCEILEREESNGVDIQNAYDRKDSIYPADIRYTVRIHELPEEEGEEGRDFIYKNVPRQAVKFFDVPYSSDLFLRSSFRHEIHLPDSMVPTAWRDRS